MFKQLEAELQKELVEFVKQCELDKGKRPLKMHLVEELLRQIIEGQREITGLITNQKNGDVFVKFSFTKE